MCSGCDAVRNVEDTAHPTIRMTTFSEKLHASEYRRGIDVGAWRPPIVVEDVDILKSPGELKKTPTAPMQRSLASLSPRVHPLGRCVRQDSWGFGKSGPLTVANATNSIKGKVCLGLMKPIGRCAFKGTHCLTLKHEEDSALGVRKSHAWVQWIFR